MNSKDISAVIVAPYSDWDANYCSIRKSNRIISGPRILDWILASLKHTAVDEILVLCHDSQLDELSYLKGVSLVACERSDLLKNTMQAFRDLNTDILYIYPRVIFHKEFYHRLISCSQDFGITVSVDKDWLDDNDKSYRDQVTTEKFKLNKNLVTSSGRFLDKKDWHASFAGVAYMKDYSVDRIVDIWDEVNLDHPTSFHDSIDTEAIRFTDFLQELIEDGEEINSLETSSDIITIQKYKQLSEFIFGTKAQTLNRLSFILEKSKISDLMMFTVAQWKESKSEILHEACEQFSKTNVIVRSSSIVEDGWGESLAGAFDSVLNVNVGIEGDLESAISNVIESYKKALGVDELFFDQHQVLIQEYIGNIDLSGVLFTRDLHTGAPYYTINYDSESGRTDSVTSGDTNNLKTLVVYRNVNNKYLDDKFTKLIASCKEIEYLVGCDNLDIEFAISNDGAIHIFQVRPMTVANTWDDLNHLKFGSTLEHIADYVRQVNKTQGKTVFSNMTDWNPAEMISTSPSPLAMSLYEYLITDSTWRVSRGECGYFNPPSESLMVSLGGKPYINARSSFKSFVPESIPEALRERFVDCWIDQLIENPDQHDKVEFDIVPTCYSFDLDSQLTKLTSFGIVKEDVDLLKKELLNITDLHISQQVFNLNSELDKVHQLVGRVSDYEQQEVNVHTIKRLLEDCRNYGILPFSNLARMAFIATAILKSLVNKSILSEDDESNIKGNIHTVTADIISDFELLNKKEISMDDFLQKYGHLRPGTYDINSKRYDEDPMLYLHQNDGFSTQKREVEKLDSSKLAEIDALLRMHGFKSNADELMIFIADAIRGREDAKFGFTKALSLALKMIEQLGANEGVARADMAFVKVHSLLRWDSNVFVSSFYDWLDQNITKNKENYMYERALNLPDIITEFTDIHIYYQLQMKPNFVTKNKVISEKICLDGDENQEINNKIVMIKSSDPGFDWIFTHKIEGLVTMFGGANSHMAIRCAEFDIPAAIGCGQVIYDSLLNGKMIEIDCTGEIVRTCLAH